MIKRVFFFHASLTTALLLSFFIHNTLSPTLLLPKLYFLNAAAAFFVYWLAYVFRSSRQEYTGFYFLAGTILKFFVFFAFALPTFKHDNTVTRVEFFSFFVPYIISLIVETISLVLLLRNTNNKFLEK